MATYVLIHGAGDVASSWDLVAEELRERGHDVIAVDLPCDDPDAGLAEYADAVVEAVGAAAEEAATAAAAAAGSTGVTESSNTREQLVVVAHSLGGFTAPLVCDRIGADLLVLVSAMIPLPGETAGEWWTTSGYMAATRGRPELDDIALYLHDVPPDLGAAALEQSRDQAGKPMTEPWPLDAWPDVETRFLLCRDDRFFPTEWMRGLVRERLGIEPDEIDGSHCVYLSRPQELAQRLDALRD
ncbi:alpha/beta hydrolase [Conexibacter sp. CPCC 206217]|uniref:alpha/beta hydrolase n=1 Tax=Conexibacter sp. CPCC 206217 TaxID=3064574 RepID=UPI0027218BD6|nr:alpha/beta hydrolase [Conexibacter sp. CPCC 206217]MDO8213618.1 alpha/beta hydrolase [Conexibacter sp. CPCC 206217]